MRKILIIFVMCFALLSSAYAQQKVTGKVTGDDGLGIPGVTVVEKGVNNGTVTDVEGNFTITAPDDAIIVFSFVGMETVEEPVNGRSTINVFLKTSAVGLEEVVVTAFGIEKDQKALGYSVTQIGGEQMVESRTVNLGTALSGKIAGVSVTTPTTGVAGASRVVIRGGSSLSGNDQPLYVINGVPMDNSNLGAAGMWGGSDKGDGLSSINPDDIESMTVLKGNTAGALYGSRAANGVILITTKSGVARKGVGVSYISNFTVNKIVDNRDFQKQYGHGRNGVAPTLQEDALSTGQYSFGGKLDGSDVIQFDGVKRPYSDTGETLNDFFEVGHTWTNTLALSGGNKEHTYRFSVSDLMNQDVMPNSGYDRQTYSLNVNGKYGKLSAQINAQYSHEETTNRPRVSDTPGNANYSATVNPSTVPFEALKGSTDKLGAKEDGMELRSQGSTYAQNPYWASYQYQNNDEKDKLLGSALLKYDFTDWLYVQGRVGTDLTYYENDAYEPYGTAYKPLGGHNISSRNIEEVNTDLLIGAIEEFGDFEVDILLGGNRMRRRWETTRVGGNEYSVPFFHSVTNIKNQTYSYSMGTLGVNSIFGQANISWKRFLFLNLTARKDYFSQLNPDDNSVIYPSIGASWIFSDAFTLPEVFTYGKIRLSYAQSGNDGGIGFAELSQYYELSSDSHYGASIGNLKGNSVANPYLKPYKTYEKEIGLDLSMFNNRLRFDFAYYDRRTEDEILNLGISGTSGAGSTKINFAELSNKGYELMIAGTAIMKPDFSWDISFNMAKNSSKAVNLGVDNEGNPVEVFNLQRSRSMLDRIRHELGEPLGLVAGYTHKRIDGKKVYTDTGMPVRSSGMEVLGEGRQPISAGLFNEFRYKNWNLSFLIDMKSGGVISSGSNVYYMRYGLHKETLPGRENGLQVTGVDTDGNPLNVTVPVELVDDYYDQLRKITEYTVYDASYGKLRELSFGYSFPSGMLKNTPLAAVKLSFVGRNLAVLWSNTPNIDPEAGYTISSGAQGLEFYSLPATRNFGFNLSVDF